MNFIIEVVVTDGFHCIVPLAPLFTDGADKGTMMTAIHSSAVPQYPEQDYV